VPNNGGKPGSHPVWRKAIAVSIVNGNCVLVKNKKEDAPLRPLLKVKK
jgi:hypothetical protein